MFQKDNYKKQYRGGQSPFKLNIKTNNMRTQNINNRTDKKVLILIAIFMGIFISGASIQILSNL